MRKNFVISIFLGVLLITKYFSPVNAQAPCTINNPPSITFGSSFTVSVSHPSINAQTQLELNTFGQNHAGTTKISPRQSGGSQTTFTFAGNELQPDTYSFLLKEIIGGSGVGMTCASSNSTVISPDPNISPPGQPLCWAINPALDACDDVCPNLQGQYATQAECQQQLQSILPGFTHGPFNVRVTRTTSDGASISWDSLSGATHYDVYYYTDPSNPSSFTKVTATTNSVSLSGLTKQKYSVHVNGCNLKECSPSSQVISFTPADTLSPTPGPTLPPFEVKKCPGGDGIETGLGCIPFKPEGFVAKIFGIILGIAGGVALLLIIYSGYRMIMAAGNPEGLQGARETMTAAIIGLLFIIFSFVILEVIGVDILGLPGFGK